ncbi:MAG: GNAT family N-acetyltransferase [Gemmatimonadota bacterium]
MIDAVRTARMLLRPWQASDAAALLAVLEANQAHLGDWIPRRVSEPAPLPDMTRRLTEYGAELAADRAWRYALIDAESGAVLGEVSLFPRDAAGRVDFAAADRVEIGYWLRGDRTGEGLVTEATEAVLAMVSALPTLAHAEIRCDERNHASAAIPRRLGFMLSSSLHSPAVVQGDPPEVLQVWTRSLRQ